jgi:FKBP-type peptidyl-prolyl cis-trans isomerase FkpA
MRHYFFLSLFVCAVALSVACGSSSTSPSPSPDSGITSLQTTDVTVGTGTQASLGRQLTVNYTGWLYSVTAPDHHGAQFDTSVGKTPFVFTLGVGQVIAGWDQGMNGMRAGGRRTLVIPPSLGYGNQAVGSIPPNSTLIFDVELLDVR